jgi:hypothetical protein
MKAIQNYSINVVVLENFNDIVPSQQRSKVIEALMIQFMIDKEGENFPSAIPSPTTEKDMIT